MIGTDHWIYRWTGSGWDGGAGGAGTAITVGPSGQVFVLGRGPTSTTDTGPRRRIGIVEVGYARSMHDASVAAALRATLPTATSADAAHAAAFAGAAELLLAGATLWIAGAAHRLTEIEFYWTSEAHPDPFTHGDPMQREFGRWYFHRQGGSYRGGTFKGLDVAVGGEGVTAGILIRGIAEVGGARVDGSCMVVEHILARTGMASVAALAGSFGGAIDAAAGEGSPLWLGLGAASEPRPAIVRSARVGLTLKKGADPLRCRYLGRHYRFLDDPRAIAKGRSYVVVALHQQGRGVAEIAAITGASASQVAKTIEAFEGGRGRDPAEFRGELSASELSALLGALG